MHVEVCNEGLLILQEFTSVVHTIGDTMLFDIRDLQLLKL